MLPVVPLAVNSELPQLFITVTPGETGIALGVAVALPDALMQPPTVCVTVYVAAVVDVIDAVVSPVLQCKFVPIEFNTELPQLSITVTTGAKGIGLGTDVPLPGALVQLFTVWVTVYTALFVTVIDEPVSPVLHNKSVPVVLNTELPQLFVTVTTGDAVVTGAATSLAAGLVHPFTVCVTV